MASLPAPALAAWAGELLLLVTHSQVLLAIGPSHAYEALKARRSYFVFDALSPWTGLATAARPLPPGRSVPGWLMLLCSLHFALHIFYIATWSKSRHTDRVVCLSSCDARRRFGGAYGAAELAWYYIGTGFDIFTHAALIWLLSRAAAAAAASNA